MYNGINLLYTRNQHNAVNHLHFNKIIFKKSYILVDPATSSIILLIDLSS